MLLVLLLLLLLDAEGVADGSARRSDGEAGKGDRGGVVLRRGGRRRNRVRVVVLRLRGAELSGERRPLRLRREER